jgi:hypothetical protein
MKALISSLSLVVGLTAATLGLAPQAPPPRLAQAADREVLVRIETTHGNIDLAIDAKRAPTTAGRLTR